MKAKQYIREIIQRSCLPAGDRKRLRIDLNNEINTALERGETIEQIIKRMGDPDNIAAELYENYADSSDRPFREYKSKRTLFGLPLVHIIRSYYGVSIPNTRAGGIRAINIGGRYNNVQGIYGYMPGRYGLPTARGVFAYGPKAKGIIAVGNISSGFISIGNISAGILSIGNISAGIFSIGNFALALLIALGNMTAGALSGGNIAFGYGTAGNIAIGEYAVGNYVRGAVTYTITNLNEQLDAIRSFFGGLKAPAPIKVFYGFAERVIDAIADPLSAMPLIVTFSIILLAVILVLCIVPRWLILHKNDQNDIKIKL